MHDAIDDYMSQGSAEGWSPGTQRGYSKALHAMADYLRSRGCRRLADVVPADLDAYLLSLVDRQSRSSRVQVAGVIRRFFRGLQERGLVLSSPARDLPVPPDRNLPLPPPPLSEAEVHDLMARLPRRDARDLRNIAMVEVAYGCGLRGSECVALNVDDVDLDGRLLHVRSGKGLKPRSLPLMKGALSALKDYLAVRRELLKGPDHGALFLAATGRRLKVSWLRNWLGRISRELGRRVHPHLLRHSIAVHLLRGKADVRYVQEFLGHSCLDTTKIYLRLVPGRLKEEYERAMPEIGVG